MARLQVLLDALTQRIESAEVLDRPADAVAAAATRLFPTGRVKDAASGTPIGHPLHPALVAVPMGSWLAASWLDVTGSPADHDAARRLVGLGLLAALPAAATGASDWLDTEGPEKRAGFVHAALNYVALGLYASSWAARRGGRHTTGAVLAGAGAGVLGASGWLGGHLAYSLGVGVDTTVFQQFPAEWTDVAAAADVTTRPTSVTVDCIPLLLVELDGEIQVVADRCTHRGAPLHDGDLVKDCVVCPWHGSMFRLTDGSVQRGPATRPQPTLETKIADGRILVRRTETHSMRENPTGV